MYNSNFIIKIKASLFLFGFFAMQIASAQITFPAGTNLCETTPWKLVWYDEFDGTAINTNKWYTFLDDADWGSDGVISPPISLESRAGRGANFLDANVTVSNGTCKLTAKYQPNTWINSYKLYSSGLIKARKSGTNSPRYFNRGKFEMKARISKAVNVWAVYWLWTAGRPNGGSEIDMFEYMPTNNADENTYSLHGWGRPGVANDPTTITGTFSYFNIDAYHIYTCEWDANYVRIYMDNQLKYEGSRYTLPSMPYATIGCQPSAGTSYIEDANKAFPFADEYMSLICSMDYRDNPDANMPDRTFEIDYIRVYQREPQSDLKDVCSYITGPSNICLNVPTTYYASIGEGTFTNWVVSPNIQILSSGTSNGQPYVTIKGIANGVSGVAANIQNIPYSCPPPSVQVTVGVPNPQTPTITTNATSIPGKKSITVSFSAPPPGTTYTWHISSTGGAVFDGTNAGTRSFLMLNGDIFSYYIYSTTACGESEWINYGYKLVNGVLQPYELQRPANPNDWSDSKIDDILGEQEANNIESFPNPAHNIVNINMKHDYENIDVAIFDANGKKLYSNHYNHTYSIISIDVSSYTSGSYYVSVRDKDRELLHHKFVKD